MGEESSTGQSARTQATALAQVLSDLKQRGSTLLLVGPAQHGAISTACRRLLGDQPATRSRLFVLAGESAEGHHGVCSLSRTESQNAIALTYATQTRGAAATAPSSGDLPGPPEPSTDSSRLSRHVGGGLGDLLAAVVDAVDELDDRAAGLEPAELRVCVDSLDALLAIHGEEAVFRFLHLLSAVVRQNRAMCHLHLSADVDSKAVSLLEPTCDAVVEVRDGGGTQQRWHVPDAELTTDWLLL